MRHASWVSAALLGFVAGSLVLVLIMLATSCSGRKRHEAHIPPGVRLKISYDPRDCWTEPNGSVSCKTKHRLINFDPQEIHAR